MVLSCCTFQDNILSDVTGIYTKRSLCNSPIGDVWCVFVKKMKDCVTEPLPSENSRKGVTEAQIPGNKDSQIPTLILWLRWRQNPRVINCIGASAHQSSLNTHTGGGCFRGADRLREVLLIWSHLLTVNQTVSAINNLSYLLGDFCLKLLNRRAVKSHDRSSF